MPLSARAPDGPNDFIDTTLHHTRYAQGDAFRQTEVARICKSHNKAIAKLPSWEAIGDDNIMKVEVSHWREGVGGPGRYETKIVPAIQYVFNGYESLDALNDKGEWSLDINFDAKIL